MAMVTNLSQTLPFEQFTAVNLRDASFSSYLNKEEENLVIKHSETKQNLSPIISKPSPDDHFRVKEEDGEIGVFGAEKYFNGGVEEQSPKPVPCKNPGRLDWEPYRPKLSQGTPSVRSQSSWNSQSALLQSVLRNPSRRRQSKAQGGKSFLSSLGCKCYCSDKHSVDVNEDQGDAMQTKCSDSVSVPPKTSAKPLKSGAQVTKIEPQSRFKEEMVISMETQKAEKLQIANGLKRENCFTFPTSRSESGNPTVQVYLEQDEKQRKSLEVFGSPVIPKRNPSLSIEKKLTMLSWDAPPRVEGVDLSATSGAAFNDADSDASSDLFEIESLTGKANPFFAGRSSDFTSDCITPTTCYPPSEASIEWSVVTASAADFSLMSDCEEQRPSMSLTSPIRLTPSAKHTNSMTKKETQKHRQGVLLGCKSQKSVRVAGDVYRTNEKVGSEQAPVRRRSESVIPMARFEAESKVLLGLGPRQKHHHGVVAHALPRPRSQGVPDVLYIH